MKNAFNWLRVLVLLSMLSFSLSACAQSTPSPTATSLPKPTATPIPAPTIKDLILATTTSTQDSGLLDVLIPIFESKTGYSVKTVAVGTGQALKMGEEGNADVLLVHAPASEKELVDKGFGI